MGEDKNKVFKLQGKVQNYAWGGRDYLPALLGLPNDENKPFAEYWMGAHEKSSAVIVEGTGKNQSLKDFIELHPEQKLGQSVLSRFGRLPYLLKVLDVKDMLSIQVHPSKANAEFGFETENKARVPADAANRNYKDDNHKPELMLALSEFWLLHGFKSKQELIQILKSTDELFGLLPIFGEGDYRALYAYVMKMDQEAVNQILNPLVDRVVKAYQKNQLKKDQEDFWAARASLTYNEAGKIDRGLFSIYFFNLLHLHPGQAVFQDAGLPHAYLEGQNIEIMANSDNVLRGGLTRKYIDVEELLGHIRFEPTVPHVMEAPNMEETISVFKTSAPDFELSSIHLNKGDRLALSVHSVQIFILIKGHVLVRENDGNQFTIYKGESFVAFDQAMLTLLAEEHTEIYRAAVPEAGQL